MARSSWSQASMHPSFSAALEGMAALILDEAVLLEVHLGVLTASAIITRPRPLDRSQLRRCKQTLGV